jgi:CHASE2 domain-containing sensor protein
MASRLNWEHHGKHLTEERGYFDKPGATFGFANLIGEEKGTIRYFNPFDHYHHKEYLSFTAALLEKSYPEIFKKLKSRHKDIETINYRRNVDKYFVVEGDDVLSDAIADNVFTDKIVLLGYVNRSPDDIEDKHYTPMNPKVIGKSPDMNGIVIHANILSMALDKKWVHTSPAWLNWIITVLIAWLHVSLFIRYYIDAHLWFHLVAKTAQLISAIFFVFLSVM